VFIHLGLDGADQDSLHSINTRKRESYMDVYLLAENVQKSYGGIFAVQNGSLELHQGEILALLGPNGAGKTTLIKILATLLKKDNGRVEVLGYDLDQHEAEIRHLFGYVGQDTERSAYARLTVVENLRFFGALRGLNKKQIENQIAKLSSQFEFNSSLDKQFAHLSGGQKQTAVIMRALLHDPPLVFLDEPTKGLDPIIARKIRSFLKQLVVENGKSILLTSHILTEVDELATRVALIHRGTIPISGTPTQLKAALGSIDFIEIEASNLPANTIDKILHLETVQSLIKRDPRWISFGVADSMAGAEAIIRVLREDGVKTRFRHHVVSLEDAFLHYIGELTDRFD
jgi:ABC-2 type transport system ATP-binding protein